MCSMSERSERVSKQASEITFFDYLEGLEEDCWDGLCCSIPKEYLSNKIFVEGMIQHSEWHGTTCCIDPDLFKSVKMILKVISSKGWNGNCSCICKNDLSTEMSEVIIHSDKWNGDCQFFTKSTLQNKDFFTKVYQIDKWDGNIECFGDEIKNDNRLMNLVFEHRKSYELKDFFTEFVHSDLWDGSFAEFPQSFFDDKSFVCEILLSDLWDGNDSPIINKSELFYSTYIYTKHFTGSNLTVKDFRNNERIAQDLLECPNWDGNASHFGVKIKKSLSFFYCLLKSKYWDGNLKYYGHVLRASFIKIRVITCERWNAFNIFYKCPTMTCRECCEMLTRSRKWNTKYFLGDKTFDSLDEVYQLVLSGEEVDKVHKMVIDGEICVVTTRMMWDKFMSHRDKQKEKKEHFTKYNCILDSCMFFLGCAPT